jgi:hypothetical protein
LAGQSVAALQPQIPAMHMWPASAVEQSEQAFIAPHALDDLPPAQVPPLQQPPLHGWPPLQAVVQVPFGPHALPAGQSAGPAQPHAPAMQAWPLPLVVQSTHAAPVPHATAPPPPTHLPVPSQQPPLQGWFASQVVVHCPAPPHAWPAGQSFALLQPQVSFARQAVPPWPVAQLTHTIPLAPQATALVPGWQVPLAGSEQQPFWHGLAFEQALTHSLFAASHELELIGQSPITLQPHWPPPPPAMHRWPLSLPAQAPHTPPFDPHIAASVPGWQVPFCAAEQQPPRQGRVASHALVHLCVPGSHASPAGHSVTLLHPHAVPPTQAAPAGSPAHEAHSAPVAHESGMLPATQLPAAQQPPLHGEVASQLVPHTPALHA